AVRTRPVVRSRAMAELNGMQIAINAIRAAPRPDNFLPIPTPGFTGTNSRIRFPSILSPEPVHSTLP
ncbi:MAG: hypothetical protein R6X35_01595, partial [Candidatus Krumholzibacteriia bacterium]